MGRKDIGIRKSRFVNKTQFLWQKSKKVNKFDNIKKILKSIKEKMNLWIFIKKVPHSFTLSKGITLNQVGIMSDI